MDDYEWIVLKLTEVIMQMITPPSPS